jgi:lipopolysaccharide exporter
VSDEQPQQSMTRRTARGMAWAYGSYVGGRVLVLVATAILARLLTPKEFGLVALALTFTAFLDMLKDFGVAEALIIVDEKEVAEKAETAWLVMQVGGVLLFVLVSALGPLAASFYDEPQLKAIMPVLGGTFILRSLGAAHYAIAQKSMDFRTRTAAELADVIVRGVAGVALALGGAGAWSLVLGYVAGTAAMTAALWLLVPWRPRFAPRRDHLRELLGFGGALTGVSLAGAVLGNVDRLLIGRVLGTAPLGVYSLASRLPELLIINLSVVAGQVLFPAFAAVDRDALHQAFLSSLRYAAMVALPLAAFMGVLAEPLVLAAFGDQWLEAVDVMQIFTLYALVSPITLVCGTVYKARGRAGLLLKMAILQVLITVPAVAIVVDDGIVAVAICQAAAAGIILFVSLAVAMRMLAVSIPPVLVALWPPVLGGLAVGAVAWLTERVVGGTWPTILVAAPLCAAAYALLMLLFARESVQRLVDAVRPQPATLPAA